MQHIHTWYDNITQDIPPPVKALMNLNDQLGAFPRFWELKYPMAMILAWQFDDSYKNKGVDSNGNKIWSWLQRSNVKVKMPRYYVAGHIYKRVNEEGWSGIKMTWKSIVEYFA